MADRTISQLPAVTAMGVTDLFVLEQAGAAKKLTGQLLKTSLLAWLDGHGGIKSITFNDDDTMTVTAADGTTWTSDSLRGPDGVSPTVSVLQAPATPTTPTAYLITITDKDGDHVFTLYDGAKGAKGDIGVHGSDVSVTVSDAAATADHPNGGKTLTITETVYSSSGGTPTQRSTNATIWDGEDGSSIQSINRTSGTGAPGTTDTYTVTLTDGGTTTFMVYNGRDGNGSGDMTQAVYDPQGKAQDIFAYADAIQTALNTALTAHADNVSLHTSDAEKAVWNGKADIPTPLSVLLMASGWDANTKEQTVSVSDMTASANILVSAAPASFMAYAQAGIRCTAQSAGALTFACETVPEEAVTANVIILG